MALLLLAMPLAFTSCETDDDSNPKLDLSHVGEGFTLNVPAYSATNIYDLANSEGVWLTCTQPNYGVGVPYVVDYHVQVSIDQNFAKGNSDAAYKELATSYTTAKMQVSAKEINSAVVELFQKEFPDEAVVPDLLTVYVKLRATISGGLDDKLGETYSNVVTLGLVHASYQAPDAEYPKNLFVIGSSIQDPWTSWKEVPQLAGLQGNYYTVVYVPAGGKFKWGVEEGGYKDYNALSAINDNAGAGISCDVEDFNNIKFDNGGWYTLFFKADIQPDGKNIKYTLDVYPAEAYIFGTVNGGTWDFSDAWKLTPPADASGEWVSPAFAASGELRVTVKIPNVDWYRSEFTILNGKLFFGNPTDNWKTNFGDDYSVQCAPGQRLYINFDKCTGEVK